MFIQIVGTNASGKTTVMRKLKNLASGIEVVCTEGKTKPKILGYDLTFDGVRGKIRLMGPYEEAATGGMDALGGTAEGTYELLKQMHDISQNVLFEGIRMCNHKRGLELLRHNIPVHVFQLTTSFEVVLESLKERRAARGDEMLEDTSHIEANMRRASNYAFKMFDSGAKRYKVTRDECPEKVLEVLRHG